LRRVYHSHPEVNFKPGPFYMGDGLLGLLANAMCISWTLFVCVIFSLPNLIPVTAQNMNYASASGRYLRGPRSCSDICPRALTAGHHGWRDHSRPVRILLSHHSLFSQTHYFFPACGTSWGLSTLTPAPSVLIPRLAQRTQALQRPCLQPP
jgi:hypothetical protein